MQRTATQYVIPAHRPLFAGRQWGTLVQSRRWVLHGLWFTDGYLYAGSGAPCAGQRRDREPPEPAPTFSVASEENLGAEPETGSGETGGETGAEIPECWGGAGLGRAAQRGGLGLGGHKLLNSRR